MPDLKLETLSSPVDPTLTPESPLSKGYAWEMDVIRDETGKIVGKEEIERKIEEGYKLGLPWGNNPDIAPYGLYKPVKNHVQS